VVLEEPVTPDPVVLKVQPGLQVQLECPELCRQVHLDPQDCQDSKELQELVAARVLQGSRELEVHKGQLERLVPLDHLE